MHGKERQHLLADRIILWKTWVSSELDGCVLVFMSWAHWGVEKSFLYFSELRTLNVISVLSLALFTQSLYTSIEIIKWLENFLWDPVCKLQFNISSLVCVLYGKLDFYSCLIEETQFLHTRIINDTNWEKKRNSIYLRHSG